MRSHANVYEKVEAFLRQTYKYIENQTSDFEPSVRYFQDYYCRGFEITFTWGSGTSVASVYESLEDGENYLRGLMGTLLSSEGVVRKDDLLEGSLVTNWTVTVVETQQELHEMVRASKIVADSLNDHGVRGVEREIYHNYQWEAFRLGKQYSDQELKAKLAELKGDPIYSKIGQSLLSWIDTVICPQTVEA